MPRPLLRQPRFLFRSPSHRTFRSRKEVADALLLGRRKAKQAVLDGPGQPPSPDHLLTP